MGNNNLEEKKEALMNFSASDFTIELLQDISLVELLSFSMSTTLPRLAFRSSWALEHILLKENGLFISCYNILINNYASLTNWSALRSYSKLLMWLLSSKNREILLSDEQEEVILEKTFHLLEDPECPIAVRANAYDILYFLSSKYDWLIQELKLIISLQLEKENTPALRSRGLAILKRLK